MEDKRKCPTDGSTTDEEKREGSPRMERTADEEKEGFPTDGKDHG